MQLAAMSRSPPPKPGAEQGEQIVNRAARNVSTPVKQHETEKLNGRSRRRDAAGVSDSLSMTTASSPPKPHRCCCMKSRAPPEVDDGQIVEYHADPTDDSPDDQLRVAVEIMN